jgi:glycosyltransferase involved in cell wall biosynthesis/2-polyprenyl-3-methyl-5-hydroxy-6-metoxy-1,4-benzoquinol methylase
MMNNKHAKKIALFGHSPYFGGAESAFVNLTELVKAVGHEPIVFLPESKKSELGDVFKAMGVAVDLFERHSIYGNTSNALLALSNRNFDKLASVVQSHACDLVISNSSTFIEGALVAQKLGLPHIWSIHEMQQKNPEQPRGGLADGAFAQWFATLSDHQLFCSAATRDAHALNLPEQPKSTVLPPFLDTSVDSTYKRANTPSDERVNLMFVGAPNVRKNPVFAIEVLAALRARGRDAHLNCLGGRRDHTGLVDGLLKRRGLKPYVHFLGKVADPYQYFSGKAINLICAKSEPFGLTVPEALSRGIPVIAPNFDGPSETLDQSCQFDLVNIDQCVRLIERVVDEYEQASQDALANYKRWQHRFTMAHQTELVGQAIDDALTNYRPKLLPFEIKPNHLQQALTPDVLTRESVIDSIGIVTGKSTDWISAEVDKEQRADGSAVGADMKAFDVVPYQPSKQMDDLYRSGMSFAIELAANYSDDARLKMAAFILVRLCTERTRLGRNLKILAVGDGIGSDSIRMAGAGFDVDYMDYEASVTSRVAMENFKKFNQTDRTDVGKLRVLNRNEIETGHYDAVISLEVIEHVEQPQEFLDFLNAQLKPEGLLFLSDCFAGITSYWQTHLLSNERLSGMIPLMAAQSGFAFEGFNQAPLCKPYVFKKSDLTTKALMTSVLLDGDVMSMLVQEQAKLAKPRIRKIDKLAYIFKRLMINVRGYFARQRLAI